MLSPHLSSILVATVFWEVEEFLAFCRGKGKFSKFAIVHKSKSTHQFVLSSAQPKGGEDGGRNRLRGQAHL